MGLLSWLFRRSSYEQLKPSEDRLGSGPRRAKDYFTLLGQIQDSQQKKNYSKMLSCCEESLPLLKSFVAGEKREYGSFDISSIPAVEIGCRYWAAMNDIAALERVREAVNAVLELRDGWMEVVEAAFEDEILSRRIKDHIRKQPGFNQNRLGKALGVSGRDTSRIVGTLANLGVVKRVRAAKTYELYLKE